MTAFEFRHGRLYAENVALTDIAQAVGTPCYVYSRAHIEAQWRAFDSGFGRRDHLVCYSVKANSNLAVLNVLARLGSGFDIVSVGELERVLAAGGDPAKIVFSGVGKSEHEMRRALAVGIHCFNVESEAEIERLNRVAGEVGRRAAISLRINPDVDAKTHPYISTGLKENKFGIPMAQAQTAYLRARDLPHVHIVGVDCHIGSQLIELTPFADAVDRVLRLVDSLALADIPLEHVDLGGGLGIRYRDENPPEPGAYIAALLQHLQGRNDQYRHLRILIEPGRAIVGNAGVLLTTVEYLKYSEAKNFAVVDAAMNDLMRPALYDAWQEIVPVIQNSAPLKTYDVVGPVCETADFLGHDRPLAIREHDLLAIHSAGAYGSCMSSNYNTRPRAAEVMVDGAEFHVVRRRETLEDLLLPESILP